MKAPEIDNIFKNGKKVYGKYLKLVYVKGEGDIILSAPIKIFNRAVDRNKIKRLLRLSIEKVNHSNINGFLIYNSKEIKNLESIEKDVNEIFKKVK